LLFVTPVHFESVAQGEPDPACAQRVLGLMAPKDGVGGRKVLKGLLEKPVDYFVQARYLQRANIFGPCPIAGCVELLVR
jgi:hypothetical protein